MVTGSNKTLQLVSGLCFFGAFCSWCWGLVLVLGVFENRTDEELWLVVLAFFVLVTVGFTTMLAGSKWIRDALIHWQVQRTRNSMWPTDLTDEEIDELD
ncbi:MAG TPA: hypothetical protein DCQ53_08225, partial [Alphaproteobacteria bacterium]|nr:hypothetical protein [Alphaproteobacteria bacterium]